MTEARQNDVRTTTLWLSLASGPLLWAAYHSLAYAIASLACQKGFWTDPLVGPVSTLTLILLALLVVFLLVIGFAGYRAYSNWRTLRGDASSLNDIGDPAGSRAGFMAFSGLALNVLFGVVTLVTFLSSLFFNPCF
jgi:hypothetical protein